MPLTVYVLQVLYYSFGAAALGLGFSYLFSSGQWQLTDAQGNSVEGGCTVDIPIEPQSSSIIDSLASLVGIDNGIPAFFPYYDDKLLDGLISDYFQTEAGMDLAA